MGEKQEGGKHLGGKQEGVGGEYEGVGSIPLYPTPL